MIAPSLAGTLAAVRERRPLVHCLTNPVAANLTANALLCLGASPVMAEAADEAQGLRPDALLVNLGMPLPERMAAARAAAAVATRRGTPWVLDPVAAGALPARTALAAGFIAMRPTLIKGNASEIIALAGGQGGRGTDAVADGADAHGPAQTLAIRAGTAVAVTGPEDHVTDGARATTLRHGHGMMAAISGLGCATGALVAACLAVQPDPVLAGSHAIALLCFAAERAAPAASGPAALQAGLLDALYGFGRSIPVPAWQA